MLKNLIRCSIQLTMLKQILTHKLIMESEYNAIKKRLTKGYQILSHFVP